MPSERKPREQGPGALVPWLEPGGALTARRAVSTLAADMGEKTRASSESLKNFSVQPRTETSAQNAFLALLDDIRGDVDARLRGFLDSAIDQAAAHGSDVEAMVAAVRDLCLRGGKRLRPALLVAGFRATGTRARLGPALDAGVALELLHTYLLIHDDWMDEAVRYPVS